MCLPPPPRAPQVDLFEGKDVRQVVQNLHALGRAAQAPSVGFAGPHLGARPATKSKRVFSEAQLAEARAAPTKWVSLASVVTANKGAVAALSTNKWLPPSAI